MNKKEVNQIATYIEAYARDECGLSFNPIEWEIVSPTDMVELVAKSGFPNRYPHWKFGMEYLETDTKAKIGANKFFELVTYGNPAVAYLLEDNPDDIQRLVIAHVVGHADFFGNNQNFAEIQPDTAALFDGNRRKVLEIRDRVGSTKVERFLDALHCIESHVDPLNTYHPTDMSRIDDIVAERTKTFTLTDPGIELLFENDTRSYRDVRQEVEKELRKKPFEPTKDVLGFLIHHAELLDWERELIRIVRSESSYFNPIKNTKIMNEGWAVYWHNRILREMDLIDDMALYAKTMAQILGNSKMKINPYRLGYDLVSHIKTFADKGRFTDEYFDETSVQARQNWDTNAQYGDGLIKRIRRTESDLTFLIKYASEDFMIDKQYYVWAKKQSTDWWHHGNEENEYVIQSRDPEEILNLLKRTTAQANSVSLRVIDGDYKKKGELYLEISKEDDFIPQNQNKYDAQSLDLHRGRPVPRAELESALHALYEIWGRPVHVNAPLTAEMDEEKRREHMYFDHLPTQEVVIKVASIKNGTIKYK